MVKIAYFDKLKYNIENVWFIEHSPKVLTTDYKNRTSEIIIEDKEGYKYSLFQPAIISAKKENRFFHLTFRNKFAFENIKLWHSRNCNEIMLTNDGYKKDGTIGVKCTKGHVSQIYISKLFKLKDKCCPVCNARRDITIESIVEEFEEVGLTVNVEKTKLNGAKTKVYFNCDKHGELSVAYVNFYNTRRCPKCGNEIGFEKQRKSFIDTKTEVESLYNSSFLLKSDEKSYVGSSSVIRVQHVLCGHIYNIKLRSFLRSKPRCPNCEVGGENNPNWKGGLTPLYEYLRRQILDWKKDSIKFCNYKCALSDKKFHEVHHKQGFLLIINELFENINLDKRSNIGKYSEKEVKTIEKELLRLHKIYGYGVCLDRNIHILYHKIYGKEENNTLGQWNQFEQDFKAGKYIEGIDY